MEVIFMYNKQIKFRADEEIEKIIAVQTDKLNLSTSEYIRQLIKTDYAVKDIEVIADFKVNLKQAIKELNAIGNNLNQLARVCNNKKILLSRTESELVNLVQKLTTIIRKL